MNTRKGFSAALAARVTQARKAQNKARIFIIKTKWCELEEDKLRSSLAKLSFASFQPFLACDLDVAAHE